MYNNSTILAHYLSDSEMNEKIAIIGLGYVGLPLAVAFAEKYKVIGFDINELRIKELNDGHDHTLEVEDDLLTSVLSDKEASELLNKDVKQREFEEKFGKNGKSV